MEKIKTLIKKYKFWLTGFGTILIGVAINVFTDWFNKFKPIDFIWNLMIKVLNYELKLGIILAIIIPLELGLIIYIKKFLKKQEDNLKLQYQPKFIPPEYVEDNFFEVNWKWLWDKNVIGFYPFNIKAYCPKCNLELTYKEHEHNKICFYCNDCNENFIRDFKSSPMVPKIDIDEFIKRKIKSKLPKLI